MAEKTLTELLAEVQSELKAPKGQRNTFGKYNYRSAEDIVEAVKPLLNSRGLILNLSDEMVHIGDRYYIKTTVSVYDKERDCIEAVGYAREALTQSGMSEGQITGATSSYARKYALNGLFAIDDTKDLDSDEYQAQAKKGDSEVTTSKATATTPTKPKSEPTKEAPKKLELVKGSEPYKKAIEALKNKTVTLAQIEVKYQLSAEIKAEFSKIK